LAPAGSGGQIDPNNEGIPASAPANGPSFDKSTSGEKLDPNHLHANPYPNVGAVGQPPNVCEAGNEGYLIGKQVIGNVPAKIGTGREPTHRTENLFRETYPAQTLADLGLTTSKPKSTGKSKGKHK
jgi:hypothetical protein